MTTTHSARDSGARKAARLAGLALLSLFVLSLAGCGSTKVYTADKNIVYRGSIYNLGNVQRVGSRAEATLSDESVVNAMGLDKKQVNQLLDEHSSFLLTTTVELDERDMVYERATVNSYSDYSKRMKNFEKALNSITKFMADKKKTQLKL
jgi:hypothetical protein